ncbi:MULTISPECIES: hypothetical protein [unclassified Sinorhizobium]|uniref:hypothetical protein n=1 Tax=unclassified Sinorhizobium TaxID=2613772 RepID=UPI0024C3E1FE|nr:MULTISPECIES: hypothetical protein [unclassified Sinorhizobium]MDK1377114.1 hypothetical protein [Sinorhizobium sp. 6-70]MDK1479591.1 hypothetical protein [Sinorhizobium sp. 6-117]
MLEFELPFHACFPDHPSPEFIQRWHEHIEQTGSPETFEKVSRTKPSATENVRLLSGELSVPLAKRIESRLVPCPVCSPTSGKFKVGRMAWFPDEQCVRFIGHDCAAKHFGETYRVADKRYKFEQSCLFYQRMWQRMEHRVPALEAYIDELEPIAKAVQFVREYLDKNAAGFVAFLWEELAPQNGAVYLKEDIGSRDGRGQRLFQDVLLGTVDGLPFISRNFRPAETLSGIRSICHDLRRPLPTWNSEGGDDETAQEIIDRGRRVEWMMKTLRSLVVKVSEARDFLRPTSLALLERWAKNEQSPFNSLVFRWEGSGVNLRAETYQGSFYCNLVIPRAFHGIPIPNPLDPVLDPISSTKL